MSLNAVAPFVLTLLAGAMVAAQPAFNGQLSTHLGSPIRAALVSFTAGSLIMLATVSVVAYRAGWPSLERIFNTPPHLFVIGGALGACFVTTAAWAAPKIGTGSFFALLFASQLIAAMAIDHFGLFGIEERSVTLMRLLGAAFLSVGAWLVIQH
ncbi:DMT family transporter [Oceanicaulis sp. LC35]|uniref:DMT family transporter n=1 Tax=Oceanicaulis sp. LC35 TaxID=3349635 RepID=UPI003F851D30